MISSKLIKKYYDVRAACQVLGILMREPHRIKDEEYFLNEKDFLGGLHQTIFVSIYNLAHQNIKEITVSEIESYLAVSNPIDYKKVFEGKDSNGLDWLNKVLEDANPVNYTHYYQRLRKMSLLRSCLEQGIAVSDILNVDELDPILKQEQQDKFDLMTIDDIIKICDKKISSIKKDFTVKNNSESRKAGDDAEKLYQIFKQSPAYGMGLESQYLNTITRGMQKKKFFLETRDSGTGKTRIAIKRLLNLTAPCLWDFKEKNFIKNPNGTNNSGLYIGTEMDLYEEIEPIMWATISGVAENKIKDCNLSKDEDERVQEAIKILGNTNLFLEHNANFNVSYLWQIIEHYKKNYDVHSIGLDYIELTSALIAEFTSNTRGMGVREDQILLDLSKNIKNIAEDFDVFMMAFTQTTDEARRDGVRDQRAVKGARSLPNKADVGIVSFEPTKRELEKIDVITKRKGLVSHKFPNICYSFYKNRGGIQEHKEIKVWGYQDLGTMEYEDVFCTDKDYKLVNVNPTEIVLVDDEIIISQ